VPPALLANRYTLLDKLGEGGMGAVYRAHDRLTGENVALKQVLSSELAERARLTLAQEFRTLASLRHPHIIPVLDYGFDARRLPYFTMPILEGAHPITEHAAGQDFHAKAALLAAVLQALAYLHRRGIIHRDLKPANVLVGANDTVRVLDFGLAHSLANPADDGVTGTIAYMSPEILRKQPANAQTDLFSAGIIAAELFSGRHPYGANPRGILFNILNGNPNLSGVPDPLREVLTSWLDPDPQNRPPDAETALRQLAQATPLRLPAETAEIRAGFLQASQFIGRAAELKKLLAALDSAFLGRGSCWLVGGESGVGKSRLLDELRTWALVRGALVLRGNAVETGGLPYQMWREPMRRIALSVPLNDMEAGVLQPLVPDLEKLLDRPIPDLPEAPGRQGQRRLAFTIAEIFKRHITTHKQPILLLCEDLQWADESLAPLKQLNVYMNQLPLVFVGDYRSEEMPALPAELPWMHTLRLERLPPDSIASLAVSMLGEQGGQKPLVERLTRETEGNVFFLIEVVRALAEEAGSLSQVTELTLPAHIFSGGMERIIQRRLGRVPAWGRALLELAAVAGRQLDAPLLHSLVQTHGGLLPPETSLDAWLVACGRAAVLEVQEDQWRFAHDKLRAALLANLDLAQLPLLHRRVAQALEAVHPGDDAYAAPLADHWHAAGEAARAADYALTAAAQMHAAGESHPALALLERALTRLVRPEDAPRQAALRRLAADIRRALGN
jgi:hypothetical protein